MVMPQDVFERIEVDIILIDVNDNAPHFRQSKVAVDIAEGELSRIEVPLLIADDADVSSELTYSIEDDDLFQLEMADGRAFLVLKTALGLCSLALIHHHHHHPASASWLFTGNLIDTFFTHVFCFASATFV